MWRSIENGVPEYVEEELEGDGRAEGVEGVREEQGVVHGAVLEEEAHEDGGDEEGAGRDDLLVPLEVAWEDDEDGRPLVLDTGA